MKQIALPPGAAAILAKLTDRGWAAYVVGGCVRDSLLGRTPQDWDICTAARPAAVRALFQAEGFRTADTGLRHGTVTVCPGDGRAYEVTTFRVDGPYGDHRRPDRVAFVDRVEADLRRRDFTVNAMAYHPRTGLVDPCGGAADLAAGVLSCVGEPEARFREDALRILRALRFASVYGFSIAPDTAAAVHARAADLARVAAERIWAELRRLLCGAAAAVVLADYRDVLARLLPQLRACPDEAYARMVRAVARDGGEDLPVRLALVLDAAENGAAALDALRLDRRTREAVRTLLSLRGTPLAAASARRWLRRLGPDRFSQLLSVRAAQGEAAASGMRAEAAAILASGQCISLETLAISGRELTALGIPPGRRLGELLEALLDQVVDGTLENAPAALLAAAGEMERVV